MVSSKSDWLIKSNPEDRSLCPYGRRGMVGPVQVMEGMP